MDRGNLSDIYSTYVCSYTYGPKGEQSRCRHYIAHIAIKQSTIACAHIIIVSVT